MGLTTHRSDLHGDCGNATDLLLRSLASSPASPTQEIVNPCPRLYDPLVEFEFFAEPPLMSGHLRVFARRDLSYREPLRAARAEDWPAPYVQSAGWLARYDTILGGWFGR